MPIRRDFLGRGGDDIIVFLGEDLGKVLILLLLPLLLVEDVSYSTGGACPIGVSSVIDGVGLTRDWNKQ